MQNHRPAVLLMIPPDLPETAGNRISAQRLARFLAAAGWRCTVAAANGQLDPAPGTCAVHALHALHAGPAGLEVARRHGLPLVVTITGTDLSQGDPAALRKILSAAEAVVVFHRWAQEALQEHVGNIARRVVVIPPGVEVPPRGPRRRGTWHWRRDAFVFLWPGAVRPIKDPDFALEPLSRLTARYPQIRLVFAGAIRDPASGRSFLQRLQGLPWAEYLGEVPHERMVELYRAVDVVLNTSRSEGLANAVLEAMAAGRPVLARDIPGNRAAIRHGRDGLLFADAAELESWAERLLADPQLRRRLGRNARRAVRHRFDPWKEAEAHARLYGEVSSCPQPPLRKEAAYAARD